MPRPCPSDLSPKPRNPFGKPCKIVRNFFSFFFHFLDYLLPHMWLMGCPNPCEMQESWELTFLKHYYQVIMKWALKRNFIVANFFNRDFKIFT